VVRCVQGRGSVIRCSRLKLCAYPWKASRWPCCCSSRSKCHAGDRGTTASSAHAKGPRPRSPTLPRTLPPMLPPAPPSAACVWSLVVLVAVLGLVLGLMPGLCVVARRTGLARRTAARRQRCGGARRARRASPRPSYFSASCRRGGRPSSRASVPAKGDPSDPKGSAGISGEAEGAVLTAEEASAEENVEEEEEFEEGSTAVEAAEAATAAARRSSGFARGRGVATVARRYEARLAARRARETSHASRSPDSRRNSPA